MLAESIATVRKINLTTKVSSWATSFRKLHDIDGIPVPRIQDVLKWYCKQICSGDLIRENSSYLPVAYSGPAFREKFARIEDARSRRADRRRREKETGDESHIKLVVLRDEDQKASG